MNVLLEDIRLAIKEQRYASFQKDFLDNYFSGKEKKEFSNHVSQRYKKEDTLKKAVLHLPFKK